MWFLYAIIALLCWSGSDLFSKIGSKPQDKFSHWKMVMAVGFVMGIHALFEIFVKGVPISLDIIIAYLPASILYILSMTIGYVGLRYIELSVSSPICNSSGAIAAILCFFILGQRLEMLQSIGVILVCIGVVSLGIVEYYEDDEARRLRQIGANVRYTKSFVAILLPVLYCLIDAAGTFADTIILEKIDENSANVAYELTFLFMAAAAFLYTVVIKRQRLSFKTETPKGIAAVCETAGQFAYVFALSENAIAAAPVISAYCVLSVVWSRIFLREKLSFLHYATIVVTVAGMVILGIFDA